MLKGILALICVSAGMLWGHPSTIRVLIVDDVKEARVELTGSYQVMNPKMDEYIGRGLFGKRYPLEAMDGGLSWGEEFPGVYQVTIVPEHGHSGCIVDGVAYRGKLHAYNVEGKLALVNEVSVEDYVRSLLSAQVSDDLSLEVVGAMAIAARTHALFDAERREGAQFHVVAEDVGYTGDRQGHAVVEKAVRQTERIVLDVAAMKGGVFPAVWTEDCAGKTAPHHRILRGEAIAPLKGVSSAHAERHRADSMWKCAVQRGQLAHLVGLEDVRHVSLTVDSESGKVCSVQVEGSRDNQQFDFSKFQELVGGDLIRSSEFQVEMEGDEVVFSGYGAGHGVGICLYSAEKMATRGDKASDILKTFYPDAALRLVTVEEPPERRPLARRYPGRFRREAVS